MLDCVCCFLSSILWFVLMKLVYVWVFMLVVILPISFLLRKVVPLVTQKKQATKAAEKKGTLPYANSNIYREWTNPSNKFPFFSLYDTFYRYALVQSSFWFIMITTPLQFGYFAFKYFTLWFGTVKGYTMLVLFPVTPLVFHFIVIYRRIEEILFPTVETSSNNAGAVFYVTPDSKLGSYLWDCYLEESYFYGNFFLCGTNDEAINGQYNDSVLDKIFWRKKFDQVGAYIAPELAKSDSEGNVTFSKDTSKKEKVFFKLNDSYLGIGDQSLKNVDLGSEKDRQQIIDIMQSGEYKGQPTLLLDFIKPLPKYGVHSLDCVTLLQPDGGIQVVSCLLWGSCSGETSHHTNAGYTIDIFDEKIKNKVKQYSAHFVKDHPDDTKYLGKEFQRTREFVLKCVESHKLVIKEYPWVSCIGWDGMLTDDDKIVYFEGNFASGRIPRIFFLNSTNLYEILTQFYWPYDDDFSIQPKDTTGWFSDKKVKTN